MKEIPLTRGKVALVDDADYEYLMQWKWYARKITHLYYALRNSTPTNGKRYTILMHRLILGLTDPKIQGEHQDHNGLNNQRYNLRIATQQQNCFNRSSNRIATSKYLGVNSHRFKDSKNTYWDARLTVNGKKVFSGLFKTEEEAARAYDEAAKVHHGKFANLNFP